MSTPIKLYEVWILYTLKEKNYREKTEAKNQKIYWYTIYHMGGIWQTCWITYLLRGDDVHWNDWEWTQKTPAVKLGNYCWVRAGGIEPP